MRAPKQRRSRERWARVLDSGVVLIERGGYEELTIAAVCELADVPPRFIYERVATKEALFLAVYEHGTRRVIDAEAPFHDDAVWAELGPAHTVTTAVDLLARIFWAHERWLRSVVLISGRHDEVRRRGAAHVDGVRRAFVSRLDAVSDDPDLASGLFQTLFAALVLRVAYGDGFAGERASRDEFAEMLTRIAERTLAVGT